MDQVRAPWRDADAQPFRHQRAADLVSHQEQQALRNALPPGAWPYKAHDQSAAAKAWRNLTSVKWALQWLRDAESGRGDAQYTAYRTSRQNILLHPGGVGETRLSAKDLALGFELALGPMNIPPALDVGIGITWFGVMTQQSVTDSATLHALLWRVQPDLLIEIGTMCGGSAIFYAKTMMGYNPRARVLTFDTNRNPADRMKRCTNFHAASLRRTGAQAVQGLNHPFWKELQASGNLVPISGSALDRKGLAQIEEEARRARSVFVIDDGSHVKESNLAHWHGLSRFVSEGSYYVVQDTRLDTDCAHAILIGRGAWCGETLRKGGPAQAVADIVKNASFHREWKQDRAVEQWGITQHPGGYLLRTNRTRLRRGRWELHAAGMPGSTFAGRGRRPRK